MATKLRGNPQPSYPRISPSLPHANTWVPCTFWIFGCMREGQGGSWLRALVISGVSTAARALQMALTDWTTRSAFSGKSPCGRPYSEASDSASLPLSSPVLRAMQELMTLRRMSRNRILFALSGPHPHSPVCWPQPRTFYSQSVVIDYFCYTTTHRSPPEA